jgi:hypothetical protein
MATFNATHSGGGTAGHPSGVAKAYVMTSPVYDAVDNTDLSQGDIVQMMDLPADTMIVGGCIETLEASGNGQITFDLGFTGGDVDCLIDGGASTAVITPFLSAAAGATASSPVLLTAADTIDMLVIDAGSSHSAAWRFRAHVVLVDVSKNPVESATVTTGT